MNNLPKLCCALRLLLLGCLTVGVLLFAKAPAAFAQQDYKTPQDAVDALVAAARSGEQKALLFVLGPASEDIVSSGDKVDDEAALKRFVSLMTPSIKSR